MENNQLKQDSNEEEKKDNPTILRLLDTIWANVHSWPGDTKNFPPNTPYKLGDIPNWISVCDKCSEKTIKTI